MHAQQAYLARNRKFDDRVLSKGTLAQPPPHKERALWNFLTWSFFIAQVLAAEQFIGAHAKAAGNLDLSSPNSSTAQAVPKSDLASLEGAASTPDDVRQSLGGSLDDMSFQSLKLGQFGGTVIDLDSISVARVDDVSQSISVAGYATDAGLAPTGDNPSDLLPAPLVDVDLPDILGVTGDVTGPLLDTVEDIVATLTGVVGGITDPLLDTVGSVVQVVDDVLEPVTDLVADITQPLGDVVQNVVNPVMDVIAHLTEPLGGVVDNAITPVTALLGITDDLAGTTQDVLASAGALTLPVLQLAGLDDLYDNGRYTDYGIEVHTDVTTSTATIADSAASVVSTATEVVDTVIDTATRPLDDTGRHLAHLLDDLGPGSLDRLL
jgi:hypothetical protein